MGAIVNDCQLIYNDFGQLVAEYQSHDGSVDMDTTPQVVYAYDNGSSNTIRQTQLIYPNGRKLTYSYGDVDGIDDVASRVVNLVDDDGTTCLTAYSYLGQKTFVITDYTEPQTKYTLIGTAGGDDPDTGDIYRGFDRFGQIKDSYWYNYGTSTDAERIKYGYDSIGNPVYRSNLAASAGGHHLDQFYCYDHIHRLKSMAQGTLNDLNTGLTGITFCQLWSLDETDNWLGFCQDDNGLGVFDLTQHRITNLVNEISDIVTIVGLDWVTPSYSRAGNMTILPASFAPGESFTVRYDAWNRVATVASGATIIAGYTYDGVARQIMQKSYIDGVLSKTNQLYFTESTSWQLLEKRVGSFPSSADLDCQFVWGIRYVDDLVARDRGINADSVTHERLYSLQDSNWNTTTLLSQNGTVEERVSYTAYGIASFYSASWTPMSDTFDWESLYAGYRFDLATGLFHVRHRVYHPLLGVWLQRDPVSQMSEYLQRPSDLNELLHHANSFDAPNDRKRVFVPSLYAYADSTPERFTDPQGLAAGEDSGPINAGNVKTYPNCGRPTALKDLPPKFPVCFLFDATWEFRTADCSCWSTKLTTTPLAAFLYAFPQISCWTLPCLGRCNKICTYKCEEDFQDYGTALIPFWRWNLQGCECEEPCKC
ncbi:MAG: repeat-associated core domain protein [Planctomycetaceae bacterium]|nr:repeat-associated core domain protein [Planctomycetaceae bacterium]